MDSKDKFNNVTRLSDLPVNSRCQQAKLLHPLKRRHSLPPIDKRNRFIRQKRIYKSVDNSDCNRPDVNSVEDQSYTINRKLSGNQMNFINSYFYSNYIFYYRHSSISHNC